MQRLTVPWIFDRHTHLALYAALRACPDLSGLGRDQALRLLRGLPGDRLTTVVGWHSGRLPFAEEDLAPLPPALLVNYSLHGIALTGAARELLRARDPELVDRHADAAWAERNLARIWALCADAGLTAAKLDGLLADLEALGVGAAEELLLPGESAWRILRASRWGGRLRCWCSPVAFGRLPAEARADVAGLKLFLDGALGARTAALSGAYRDGARGILLHEPEALRRRLAEVQALGKPVALHAIGDLAVGQALEALASLDRAGLRFPGVRLEHAQFVTEEQARRARDLGVVLSMQPVFAADSADYADRLEARWLEANQPMRMLIDRCGFAPGRDLLFGSDGMPHGVAPALRWALFPPFPGQRLSAEELLAGFGVHAEGRGTCDLEVDEARREVRLRASWPRP
jgi:predicted amidohydrolase YtcJ